MQIAPKLKLPTCKYMYQILVKFLNSSMDDSPKIIKKKEIQSKEEKFELDSLIEDSNLTLFTHPKIRNL